MKRLSVTERAQLRDPRFYQWGYFHASDQDQEPGMFLWFSDPQQLAEHIIEYGIQSEQQPLLRQQLQRLLSPDKLEAGLHEPERLCVNEFTEGWQVAWWGNFMQLCMGSSEFERWVRDGFRTQMDAQAQFEAQIRTDELSWFVQFLRNYGY